MKGVVAVFVPNIHTIGRHENLHYLRCKIIENGYKVMIFSSFTDLYHGDALDVGEKSIYSLYDRIDMRAAVIYSELLKSTEICDEITAYCKKRKIPVFAVEREIKGAYGIFFDYETPFRKLVDHVIEEHGAKDICLLSGIKGNNFSEARNEAYRRSLKAHGLRFNEKDIYYGEFWDQPARAAVLKMLSERSKVPDALVCANDTMAISAAIALQENGLNVPEDIIVTGIDGIERAEIFSPSITTAKIDYRSAGDYIVSKILAAEKGVPIVPERKEFGCNQILGQSCGCKPVPSNAASRVYLELDSLLDWNRMYRMFNDHMLLSNMDDRGILGVLDNIKKQFSEVLYSASELYLDPTYFGYTDTSGAGNVLAVRTNVIGNECSVPFKSLGTDDICSEELLAKSDSMIFVPVHCLERVYGYAVMSFDPSDSMGAWRIYDFITHLNILLASVEVTTQLNETIEQLGVLYIHDQLTELLNRRGFYREVRRLFDRAESEGQDLLFVSGDLNGLKYINDNFGHSEGDFAIANTAKILYDAVGENGICARFGGDEYMIAMLAVETADSFEARVYTAIDKFNLKGGKPYDICVSLGCEKATVEDARKSMHDIMKRADDKMFAKKVRSRHSR